MVEPRMLSLRKCAAFENRNETTLNTQNTKTSSMVKDALQTINATDNKNNGFVRANIVVWVTLVFKWRR